MIPTYLLGGVALLVGVAVLIGRRLPADHIASVTGDLPQPPQRVWPLLTGYAGYAAWRPDLKGVTMLPDEGDGPRWQEVDRWGGRTTYAEVTRQRPRRLVVRIANENGPFTGQWTYLLEPVEDGTRLTITEEGTVSQPLLRLLVHTVWDQRRTMRQFLAALEVRLQSS